MIKIAIVIKISNRQNPKNNTKTFKIQTAKMTFIIFVIKLTHEMSMSYIKHERPR